MEDTDMFAVIVVMLLLCVPPAFWVAHRVAPLVELLLTDYRQIRRLGTIWSHL